MKEKEELKSKYFEAVRKNAVNDVRTILEQNPAFVNSKILGDATLLNEQVWKNKKIVNISLSETRSSPAIHYSVFHGHYEMLKTLLEFGADINSIGYENNHEFTPPIVLAAWEGGDAVLELLLQNGADPNLKSSNKVSAMTTAIKHDKESTVRILKEYGAI